MPQVSPDPTIYEYVVRVCKADDIGGEVIGQALVFERQMNAWYDKLREEEGLPSPEEEFEMEIENLLLKTMEVV